MANAAFDTLTVSKDLQEAGFEARQAEAIALAFKQSQGDLATKQDIAQLKSDITQLESATRQDIAQLEAATKQDIAQLKSDIDHLRADVKTAINWTRWSMAAILAFMLAGFGFIAS